LADWPHYSWQEQIFLPLLLFKLRPDLVHFPHFNVPLLYGGKQVVTIHDLIKHHSRGQATTTKAAWLYWPKYWVYRWLMGRVVRRAKQIITVSRWTKKELQNYYPAAAKKITVVYNGVGSLFADHRQRQLQSEDVLEKYQVKRPYLIYTGSLYPHKNVRRLVLAVRKIGINLVVVSSRNVFWRRFRHQVRQLQTEKLVNLVGFVPDEELVVLYRQAEAFVFPSLLEGFGLPGLEAMSVGTPVMAANAAALPEIYGPAALYFNPQDTDQLVQKINSLLNNPKIKERLIERGLEQVKKYSWVTTARQTIKIYESCFGL